MALDFETVVRGELPVLYRVAKRLVRDSDVAEDLVSNTLLSAARGWENFDGRYPRSWLVRILRNEHLTMIRAAGSRPKTVGIEDQDFVDDRHEANMQLHLEAAEIMACLDSLPEEFRIVVALCDVEEMDQEDVSNALDIPVGTVKSRLFRGRRMLRQRIMGRQPICT